MNNNTISTYSIKNFDLALVLEGFRLTYDYPTFDRFADLAIALDCIPNQAEVDFWGVSDARHIKHSDGRVGMMRGNLVAIEEAFEDEALVSALLASIG